MDERHGGFHPFTVEPDQGADLIAQFLARSIDFTLAGLNSPTDGSNEHLSGSDPSAEANHRKGVLPFAAILSHNKQSHVVRKTGRHDRHALHEPHPRTDDPGQQHHRPGASLRDAPSPPMRLAQP
eukprot:3021825-Alexandrium_andersonii.AAC.1